MPRARFLIVLVLVVALTAGCAAPPDDAEGEEDPWLPFTPRTTADYPTGETAECPPVPTLPLTIPLNVTPAATPRSGPENVVVVDEDPERPRRPVITWVWAHVVAGERADDLARTGEFEVASTTRGDYYVCGSVNLAAPTEETPPADRNATLQLRVEPGEDLRPGNYTFIVNWHVGCRSCDGVPQGNATGSFTVPHA